MDKFKKISFFVSFGKLRGIMDIGIKTFYGERSGRMKSKDSDFIARTRLIRLTYYNDTLLKNGYITTREHQRMNNAILAKYVKANSTNM